MSSLIVHLTIDQYLELVERAKTAGIKEGESMEPILNEMIKEGKITTMMKTERTPEKAVEDLKKHWEILDLRRIKDE